GDRAAKVLAPELLAGSRVEGIEIAANIAEEHDAPGGRSHAAEDRIVRLQAPLPDAGVSVDRVYPSSPGTVRADKPAKHQELVKCRHYGPGFPKCFVLKSFEIPAILQPHRVAPLDLPHEDKVRLLNVGRAVPFRATNGTRTEVDSLVWREWYVGI